MFKSWAEYRDYLLEHLIENPKHKAWFATKFAAQDAGFLPEVHEKLHKMHIASILVNDNEGTKMRTFYASNGRFLKARGKNGGYTGP